MSIGTLLPRHARYRPDHLALVFEDHRLTFRQFNARVNRLANALLAAGLAKGDKIATVLPNCLEQLEVYWAAAKTGLVVVPMSPLLQEPGLASLLDNSDSALVISTPAFADMLDRVRGMLPAIRADRWVLIDGARPGFRGYADLRGASAGERAAGGRTHRRRSLQHHLLQRHHRRAQGHRAHARGPRRLLHDVRLGVPHDARERVPARGIHRLQRRLPRPDAVDVPRRAPTSCTRRSTPAG